MGTDDSKQEAARRQAERELDAFNAEDSGTLAGYRGKHLPEDPDDRKQRVSKKDDDAKRQLSALQSLLASDPAYAALYNDTFKKLRDAERAIDAALTSAQAALGMANEDLADTLDAACTLPDGTKVFRDANGEVFTEDGERVSADDQESIVWREGSPSYEDYLKKRDAVSEAEARIDALRDYQTNVLGDARNRMEDEDNPPSKDELEEIGKAVDQGMERLVQKDAEPVHEPAIDQAASISLPPMK